MLYFLKHSFKGKLCLIIKFCLVVVFYQPGKGLAEEETVKPTLNLSQALNKVLMSSPKLSSSNFNLRIADARTVQAGLRPNPELSLAKENFSGDMEFSGNDSAENTIAISQEIELGGKRRYRKEVARLGANNAQLEYEFARLDVLNNAANRFLDVAKAQHLLLLSIQYEGWIEEAERAAHNRFKAGSASRAELSQARIELMNANLAVTKAKSNVVMASRNLAGLWGAEKVDFGEVQTNIFIFSNKISSYSQLEERLAQSLYLQRYVALDKLRQAELKLAIAEGRNNVNISLGVRQFEATDNQALVFELSMPLGFSDRNQGEIEEAKINMESLESEKLSTTIQLENKLYSLFQSLQQSHNRVEILQSQALPEADKALSQIDEGYRNGRFSYLELVETQRQRLSVKRDIIDAAIEYHRTIFSLEQILGEALSDSALSIMTYTINSNKLSEDIRQ